jgi:hypothetical protein
MILLPFRDAGRACGNISMICPICRQPLSHCSDYAMIFSCGHGYHSTCLGESKSCYKCLNTKGWAPIATNIARTAPKSPLVSCKQQYLALFLYFRYFRYINVFSFVRHTSYTEMLSYYSITYILQRKKQLLPPEFLRHKDLTLRLAPPCSIPDLEGII